MLWYRAWLETRLRFFVGAALIAAVTAFFVLGHPFITRQWRLDELLHPEWPEPWWFARARVDYPYFLWHFLFAELLQQAWTLSAVLLGLGGLTRESVQGNATFTLSLPVSRRRLHAVRILVAGAEVVALGLLPALLVPILSAVIGEPYPAVQALSHGLLMVAAGLVIFAVSVFLSTTVPDEHTPLLVSVSAAALLYFMIDPYADGGAAEPVWVRGLNLPRLMAGPADLASLGDVPWLGLGVSMLLTTLLLLTSFRVTEARDY